MQAQIRHDPARGAGYGIISLDAFEGQETDILFSLRRASDGKYLGSGGWLEAEQRLAPDMVQLQGDSALLLVGPAVVDKLEVLDTFAITAYPADGEGRRYGLDIGELVYSVLAGGQGVAQSASAPLSMSPMPEIFVDPAPEQQPAPQSPFKASPPLPPLKKPQMPSLKKPAPLPPLKEPTQLSPLPEPATSFPELKDPVEPKGKAPLILLLFVLACAAGGVYLWQSKDAAPTANATAPASQAARAPLPSPSEAQPALRRARELLRAGVSPEQAVETAKSMQTPEDADGAFLLLEDAAQKGKAEAMLDLARFYDPADTAPKGSIRPDPEQARDWYNKAKDKGQGAADDKLKALRAWAEAEKDRNPQAKSLLESWK